MRATFLAAAGIVFGFLTTAAVVAQDASQTATQPTLHTRPSFVLRDDSIAAPATSETAASHDAEPCPRRCFDCKSAEPWTLPQPKAFSDRNITVSGWLSGGIYGNQYGAASNGPIGMRGVGDGFTADQLYLVGERKTDAKGCGWDFGGRIDYLFGADGPDTQAFGDRTWITVGTPPAITARPFRKPTAKLRTTT